MKKRMVFVLAGMICLFSALAWGADQKFSDLMKIPEFAKGSPEDRLSLINAKIESKEFASNDVNSTTTSHLIMDVLVSEPDPTARMKKYGEIREKFPKLISTYDIETHLATQYMATNPDAIKADLWGKMKILQQLKKENILSWPSIAPLHKGMLAVFLATDEKYQKMSPMEKIDFLSTIEGMKIASKLTSSGFAKGVAYELVSSTPEDKREELNKKIQATADYFTKTSVRKGYFE